MQQLSAIRTPPTRRQQRGIGLLEILITLLILSIGLIGTAQLQLVNQNNSRAAEARMSATLLAADLAERMRANRQASLNGEYLEIGNDPGGCPITCDTGNNGNCSTEQQIHQDRCEWLGNLKDLTGLGDAFIPLLPHADANLEQGPSSARFTLTLNWQEQDTELKQWIDRSYIQVFEL